MKCHAVLLCILATTTTFVARASDTNTMPPGRSRAEVKAETLRALAAGEITFGDVGYPRPAAVPTSKARAPAKTTAAAPASISSGGPAS